MFKTTVLLFVYTLTTILKGNAQSSTLSVKQQNEDFIIFKGGLQEGHSGLYYFISKVTFDKKCDSIQNTFYEGSSIENYYLKLRHLITLLNHGHTRISLPTNGNINYKMAVLDSSKLYLPFEFIIINKQLIIKEDCSKEQLFPKYSVVKSINNVSAKTLLNRMLQFIPADGINNTFKYYNLYNYFYFHYLFNLYYPDKKGVKIEVENNNTHYYIKLLKAREIDKSYFAKNKRNISHYDKQLEYKSTLPNQTAYLKVGSFYKGLIEQFGQQYEAFLDSAFADIKLKNLQNLIVDLRDNEGGGDGYDNILVSNLIGLTPKSRGVIKVPGRVFKYNNYAINLSDDVKGFIGNPTEFLRDDSTLYLKDIYVDMMSEGNSYTPKNNFTGNVIVLTNGGSFSASTSVISQLYKFRKSSPRKILFVGEENGGDIFTGAGCAGQGYTIKLPNSSIQVDMPFLCFGELKKDYPKKRLPDYEVYDKITDLKNNKDNVLGFAIKLCGER